MSTLTIISLIVGGIGLSVFLVYLIKDTYRYHQRESLRTLKLQKLEYYNKTGDKQMIKDIDKIEKEINKI